MNPIIETIEITERFRYLWLKYVTGVNLEQHCAKCLKGQYSKKINPHVNGFEKIVLDESHADYYYLCGVSIPYKWEKNFHLAFKYMQGSIIELERLGIKIKIRGAELIPIIPTPLSEIDSFHKHDPAYNTCRNWQFATMIADEYA